MSRKIGARLSGYLRPLLKAQLPVKPATGFRWSRSSTTRQWSTPLAKNLAEVIAVDMQLGVLSILLMDSPDYWSNINSSIYAPMPHIS